MIFNRRLNGVNIRGMLAGVAAEAHAQKFRRGVAAEHVTEGGRASMTTVEHAQ